MKKYVFIGILIILLISGAVVYALNKQQIPHTSENEIPGIEESIPEEIAEDEIIENIEVKELMEETEIPSIEVETAKQKEEPKQTKQQDKPATIQQTTPAQEKPKEEKPAETPKPTTCTTIHNHGTDVGNTNKWYNTKAEAVADYTAKVNYWSELWGSFQIDTPTYEKNCPSGYEVWTCFYCNKWTINYYYK